MLFAFVFILVLIICLSYLLDRLIFITIKNPKYFYYFIAPGVILHESSHALACLITGAKILDIKLISSKGGYVKHTESKLPYLGQVLISLAPVIFTSIIFVVITSSLNLKILNHAPSFLISNLFNWRQSLQLIWQSLINYFQSYKNIKFLDPRLYIFLYLMLVFVAAMAPSKQDLKNSFIGLLLFCVIFNIYFWLGFLVIYLLLLIVNKKIILDNFNKFLPIGILILVGTIVALISPGAKVLLLLMISRLWLIYSYSLFLIIAVILIFLIIFVIESIIKRNYQNISRRNNV